MTNTCPHDQVEPVKVTGLYQPDVVAVVAQLCVDCGQQLPAYWACGECQWVEVKRLCDLVPTRVLGQPCPTHAKTPEA